MLALWAGCAPEPELTGEPLRAQAQALWQSRCANCHGVTGRGDGATGRSLDPRPRDFQDAAWQTRVDDARLRRVIVEGGAALGLSAEMAANVDLADRPAMVGALVEIVRGFADQARDRGMRETK
ncbi:MAG: c-type cytochrome [Nannocystis sp.]|nr:c-type cytochrome [Nannocystis sp.]MBA3545853.1 c-type cytochrome [Nannocystis sp.]